MKKTKRTVDLDWQEWRSGNKDLVGLPDGVALRIFFQTHLINVFERAVIRLKADDCVHGPIHISIGQEALAAAAMAALGSGDKISGSHRAHHHFLAKTLNHVLPEAWNPLEQDLTEAGQEVVTRTLGEIMGLRIGYCGGRGGSMHLRNIQAGVLGTNAIVGGGIPLSAGAAFAEKHNKTGNVVVAFFGDGAINQGSFHETANMASLWELPIIFVVENNQYAVATSVRDACAVTDLAQHAASYAMRARTVDGTDPAAVHLCMHEVVALARAGAGPTLIEARCYRHLHHGGDLKGSQYGYRSKEEEAEWLSKDPLTTLPATLIREGLLDEAGAERIREMAEAAVEQALQTCVIREGEECQVRAELWPDADTASEGLRSSGTELEGLPYRERSDFQDYREVRYSDAIAEVTRRWMEQDPTVFELGEEIANMGGGAYGATKGLAELYPDRVLNTPISEGGFSGLGLGAAMNGMKTVIEIMFPDFTLVAADQIFNQIAKARHMYGGTTDLPLVLRTRIATGQGYGGQHSMDPVGLYAAFPGWRIVAPSSSFDYVGLFNTAMHSLDPVLVLEHNMLYTQHFPLPQEDLDFCIPFGKARVVREGTDITLLTYGILVGRLAALAQELDSRGISVEIIDLRTLDLASVDWDTIGKSVAKTGVVSTVEEAAGGQAIGRRVTSEIAERFFDDLDGPPGVLTSLDIPNPVSRALESAALLDDRTIAESVQAMAERRWR